jgi:hypothetical protein
MTPLDSAAAPRYDPRVIDTWPPAGPQKRPPTLEPHLPLAAYREGVDHRVDRRRPVAFRASLFERDHARLARGQRRAAARHLGGYIERLEHVEQFISIGPCFSVGFSPCFRSSQ